MKNDNEAIRAEGIVKRFGDLTVLRGVSLAVKRGEVVCIMGPSGSGKSTLLRCLNWLSPPTEGTVWLAGEVLGTQETPNGTRVPLPDSKLRRQRSRIGMVFQSFNLWPHRTAIGNVMEGPMIVSTLRHAVVKIILKHRIGHPGHIVAILESYRYLHGEKFGSGRE